MVSKRGVAGLLLSEFLGTLLLVYVVVFGLIDQHLGWTVALGAAVTLSALIGVLGGVSGCHVNPAITFTAVIVDPTFGLVKCVMYMLAQFGGGVLGAFLAKWTATNEAVARGPCTNFGTTLGVEIIFSTLFLLTVLRTAILQSNALAALLIPMPIMAIAYSGASATVNPAVGLAVATVLGSWKWYGPCVLGTFLGGALAVVLAVALEPKVLLQIIHRRGSKYPQGADSLEPQDAYLASEQLEEEGLVNAGRNVRHQA